MADSNKYKIETPSYDLIPSSDSGRLIDAAYTLLWEMGIKFEHHERAFDLLSAAGCTISNDGIVKFPRDVVEDALKSNASSARIWNRQGDQYIDINNEQMVFYSGGTTINFHDPLTGERRPSTKADLALSTRIADALPNIDGIETNCKITERADIYGEMEEFAVMVENSSKPLNYLCEKPETLKAVIEMARVVRGGAEELREKPYVTGLVSPLPACFTYDHTEQMFLFGESGIPYSICTAAIGGASAPVTIVGSVLYSMLTDIAGIVLSQLISKGSFCLGGSESWFLDPRSGNIGSMCEYFQAGLVRRQVYKNNNIPIMNYCMSLSAGDFNHKTVFEMAMYYCQAMVNGGGQCVLVGSTNAALDFSPRTLVLSNEMIGFLRHIWKGVAVDDERLAIDLIKEVGPNGSFLSQRHTARHMRSDSWDSKYWRASSSELLESENKQDLVDLVDEDLKSIIDTYEPEPLEENIKSEIHAILQDAGA